MFMAMLRHIGAFERRHFRCRHAAMPPDIDASR